MSRCHHLSLAIAAIGCLATGSVLPAWAADVRAASMISSVTVFPTGAQVTRTVDVDLQAGEHTVILDRLPGNVEQQSLRVEGTSTGDVAVGSVDVRTFSSAPDEDNSARRDLERQIEQLTDERTAIGRRIEDARFSRELMAVLAQRDLQPAGKEMLPSIPAPADLSSLLDLVNTRLAQVSKTVLDAQVRQREIDRQVEALNRRLSELAPAKQAQSEVSIHVTSAKPAHASLNVTYRRSAASWQPVYEARLETGESGRPPRLTLIRLATVVQETMEPWNDVVLTLSTARPTGATTPPPFLPLEIQSYVGQRQSGQIVDEAKRGEIEKNITEQAPLGAPPTGGGAVQQMQATATVAGFHALYAIPGRVTIDNTGTSKSVRIGSEEVAAKLLLKAAPKLDLTAFLVIRFAPGGDTPLLPGTAMLFRDGVFIGQGSLPLLSPGEQFDLGFGADDLVKIARREVAHKKGETGLITSAYVDERSYVTTIDSRHTMTIPITVLDQVPYALDERIRIELLPDTTPPTEKDVEKKRGVYAWLLMLEPKSRNEIKFGFRVTWPKDMTVLPPK